MLGVGAGARQRWILTRTYVCLDAPLECAFRNAQAFFPANDTSKKSCRSADHWIRGFLPAGVGQNSMLGRLRSCALAVAAGGWARAHGERTSGTRAAAAPRSSPPAPAATPPLASLAWRHGLHRAGCGAPVPSWLAASGRTCCTPPFASALQWRPGGREGGALVSAAARPAKAPWALEPLLAPGIPQAGGGGSGSDSGGTSASGSGRAGPGRGANTDARGARGGPGSGRGGSSSSSSSSSSSGGGGGGVGDSHDGSGRGRSESSSGGGDRRSGSGRGRGGSSSGGTSSEQRPLAPPLLTTLIKEAGSLERLQQLEQQHGDSFNFIHTSAAFSRAAHIASSAEQAPGSAHPLMARLWRRLRPQLGDCGARSLANIVWACGKAGFAEKELLDACLARLVQGPASANAHDLSNTVYGASLLWERGYRIDEQQAQQLVAALAEQRRDANCQDVANALWAAATMGLRVPASTWEQLLQELADKAGQARPQGLANALWAAATMGLQLPASTWARLLQVLADKAAQARPQQLANALWATAKRTGGAAGSQGAEAVGAAVLRLAAAVGPRHVAAMNPQDISNSLWALAQLRLCPQPLVGQLAASAVQQAPAMTPQGLSNAALAAAKLGLVDAPLFAALVGAAQRLARRSGSQGLCNLAWSVAVADQRQLAAAAVELCECVAAAEVWGSTVLEDHMQLHQVHLWLLDGQPDGGGLAGALSAEQLQRCEEAWEGQLQETAQQRRGEFKRRVFAAAQRLPTLTGCRQEARTGDGAFSIDVAAKHAASGRLLAIEADGPFHFLRPGRRPTGETLARNRALAARGYVVVCVPWWEWAKVQGDAVAEEAYLARAVEAAVSRCTDASAAA
jgi:hypothetical protein